MNYLHMAIAALVDAQTQGVLIEIVLQRIKYIGASGALIPCNYEHNCSN